MKNLFVLAFIVISHNIISIEGNDAIIRVNVNDNNEPKVLLYHINRFGNTATLIGILKVVNVERVIEDNSEMFYIKKKVFSDY